MEDIMEALESIPTDDIVGHLEACGYEVKEIGENTLYYIVEAGTNSRVGSPYGPLVVDSKHITQKVAICNDGLTDVEYEAISIDDFEKLFGNIHNERERQITYTQSYEIKELIHADIERGVEEVTEAIDKVLGRDSQ